ncbi:MAG TPA: hypothetical protein VKA07_01735 [Candidatus Sulfotelmatobacter sp.]|nr:hypothetical protein [Candidatus Sulfotelmatobacter sp.]
MAEEVEAAAFMVAAVVVAFTVAVVAASTAADTMAVGMAVGITAVAITAVVTAATTVDLAATVDVPASPVAAALLAACVDRHPQAEAPAHREPGPGRDAEARAILRPAGILSDPGMARAWRDRAADHSVGLPGDRALEMLVEGQAI